MGFDTRFARLRDGRIRLRVVASGDDLDLLTSTWPAAVRFRHVDAPDWQARAVVEPDQLATFLTRLEACGGTLADLSHKLGRDLAQLAQVEQRRRAAPAKGPVIDDPVLRTLTHAHLTRRYPQGRRFDELGIAEGAVRVDVAALTADTWVGVELKGATDSLARLPRQVAAYSAIFDRCLLVTTLEHRDHALDLVPAWWQVQVVSGVPGGPLTIRRPRKGGVNPAPSAYARAQLLWRDEVLAELKGRGLGRGTSRLLRDQLWARLAEVVDAEEMRALVTAAMAARIGWRG